jgi:UDP-N-acetyl-D-mannosaminuronate dehydrogenase
MNIQTVAENLRNTIAGKERMLTAYNATLYKNFLEGDVLITAKATAEFLEININELKRILQDVEKC